MSGTTKDYLADHAACCGHVQWWREAFTGKRQPFALPGTKKRYAPDLPFKVHHVKLVLHADPVKKTLSGTCYTTVEPIADPITEVFFQSHDLVVSKASIGGGADTLVLEPSDDGYKVTLPKPVSAGEKIEIALEYNADGAKAGVYFTGPSAAYPNKPYQLWTQGQDEDAHFWFPVAGADYPNHKMTSEVVVTVPKQFTALSNGELIRESIDEDAGTRTFHWLHNKPHVCYLLALIVGVFAKLESSYKNLPVQLYCDPSLLPQAKEYFKDTEDLVALYSRLYGVEYPWSGKYAQVMVQDFIFGGMENTTMTVMTDRILADHTTFNEYRHNEISLNSHELNHHWNGDYITCRDWSHAWLNEGAATYGEVEAMEHIFGLKDRDYYVMGLANVYFNEDRRYRRPIVSSEYREPIDLFDRHLYQKGGLVRHMIRYLLGDEGYYRSVKTFLTDNAYQSVETLDLIKAIEKATGRNLRQFFDQWVFGAGFPEYKLSYSWDARGKVATIKVSQTQKLELQTGLFSMPIRIGFKLADGSNKEFVVQVSEAENSFHFSLDSKPVMLRFDPENWILKTLQLDLPKNMLIHQLHHDPAVPARIQAAQALAKRGGTDVVAALERAVKDNFFWSVSLEAAQCLGTIGTPAAREALLRAVSHQHPRVRRAVVAALGNYKEAEVAAVLASIVAGDKERSVFVRGEAALSLGKTKCDSAFTTLEKALDTHTWLATVRVGALRGLAELGDPRAVDLAAQCAGAGQTCHSRPAAIAALGKLAAKCDPAVEQLHKLAESEETDQFTLRMALIGALGEAKKPESVSVLSKLHATAYDGRVKRAAAETLEAMQSEKNESGEVTVLKEQVDKLALQVRELSEKLAANATKR